MEHVDRGQHRDGHCHDDGTGDGQHVQRGIGRSIRTGVPCPETVLVVVMSDGSYLLVDHPQGEPTAFVFRDEAGPLRQALDGVLGNPGDEAVSGNGNSNGTVAPGHKVLGSVFTRDAIGLVAIHFRLDSLARFAPSVVPHLSTLKAAINRHTLTLLLRVGTGYVLNNRRWLRSRTGFEGPRLMCRGTAHPYPESVPTKGFRPISRPSGEKAAAESLISNDKLA